MKKVKAEKEQSNEEPTDEEKKLILFLANIIVTNTMQQIEELGNKQNGRT